MQNCVFRHTISTSLGPMEVEWECAPPKDTAAFLLMFEIVTKHFPPTPEQVALNAQRDRECVSPSPRAMPSTPKRRR